MRSNNRGAEYPEVLYRPSTHEEKRELPFGRLSYFIQLVGSPIDVSAVGTGARRQIPQLEQEKLPDMIRTAPPSRPKRCAVALEVQNRRTCAANPADIHYPKIN